jgi:hypothetical protein
MTKEEKSLKSFTRHSLKALGNWEWDAVFDLKLDQHYVLGPDPLPNHQPQLW